MKSTYALLPPRALAVAVATALGLAGPPVLMAQTAPAASDSEPQEVVVTGSRIVRRDYTASTPLTTVSAETFEKSSTVGVEASLNQLPQFQPAGTQFVANNVQSSAFASVGTASVNLRGIGTNRTLVLIDGKRAEPADATLVIDVNSIPSAAIANVEVITGGASAVYGADAIGGVVNFILKDNFEGLVFDAQSSMTERGDGEETRINALFGGKFADSKGNVMFGADWTKRSEVLQADRQFYRNGWADPGTPGGSLLGPTWRPTTTATQPTQAALNSVFSQYPAGSASRLAQFYFNSDNTIFQGSPALGYTGNDPTIKLNSNGNLSQNQETGLISSPLERYSAFGRASYRINGNATAYIQANFSSTQVESVNILAPAVTFWAASIPYDTAHPVPSELATLLNSRPVMATNPSSPWSLEQYTSFLGPEHSTTTSNVYQVMGGVKGDIGGDWTYDVYASEGRTSTLTYLDSGFASLQRYQQIVSAPNYGKGFSVNANNGFVATCTSGLSPFVSTPVSQDCVDAITAKMKNYTDFEQQIFETNLQGGLFDLPAGTVRTAVGATYRKDSVVFNPDALLSVNSITQQPIGLFAVSNTSGSTNVKEVYSELLVPILKDLPLVKEFDLELGGRYSKYNTAGGQTTWKSLLNWSVNNYVSIRGGVNRAARAPNTAELFSGSTLNVVTFSTGDPCASNTLAPWGNVASNPNRAKVQALCSAIIGTGNSRYDANPGTFVGPFGFFPLEIANLAGNPNLQTEVAKTWTAGAVFRSPFAHPLASNLTASLDYYNIKIDGAIAPVDPFTTYGQCLNANGTSNPNYSIDDAGGYCKLITRDPVTGDRLRVAAPYLNLGGIRTSGVDLQLNWRANLSDMGMEHVPGALSINYLLNYLNAFDTQSNPGAPFLKNAGTLAQGGQYRSKMYTTFGYELSSVNVSLSWRHLPSVKDASVVTSPNTTIRGVGAFDMFDLSAGWQATDVLLIRAGVDNLLDKQPPIVGANPPTTNNATTTSPNYYDLLGRRYFVGFKAKF